MHSSKGHQQKAAGTLWQMCLPLLTALLVLAGAVGAISLIKREIPDVPGITDDLLRLVPWLVAMVAGVAAGLAVWMIQKIRRRRREMEAANRALERLNEQLRLQVENALQSEQRSQLLFMSNPCPMLILDCQTLAITDANDAAVRLYGYTRDEFLRFTALDIRPPEEHERCRSCLQQPNSGYARRGIWTHRRKDGSDFPVDIGAFRFFHDGTVLELVLIQDVSVRVNAEAALVRSQTTLKSMVNNAPLAFAALRWRETTS